MKLADRATDAYGRVVMSGDSLFDLVYQGFSDFGNLLIEDDAVLRQYNEVCRTQGHSEMCLAVPGVLDQSPAEFHAERAKHWFVDPDYATLDMRALLLGRCRSAEQRARVELELTLFESRGLLPVLRLLHWMCETLRSHGVWWGVGRGSSVASYCLYLLGVHKIDALAHNLCIREFLK